MKRLSICATALIVCLATSLVTQAAESPKNAALLYWQAVALVPELTLEEKTLLNKTPHGEFRTVELNDTSQELVKRCGLTLTMMRRGAQIPECDWGILWEDGAAALMPHMGKVRMLVRLAVLRARHRLQATQGMKDDDLESVEDLVAAIQLARHTGSDDILISQMFRNAMEEIVFDVLSKHLFKLHPDAQQLLLTRLDELTQPHGLSVAVLREKQVFIASLRKQFSGKQADGEYANLLNMFDEAEKARIKKQAPDVAAVVKLIDDMEKRYDEAAEIAKLPPDQIKPQWDVLIKRVKAENIIANLLLPSIGKARESDAKAEVRRAMLKAAVRAALDQQSQFTKIKDPFGKGAFERRDQKSGVTLISALTIKGQKFEASFQ